MRQPTPNAARLALFWFGIQVIWGALLGVSLQSRSSELASGWELSAYALLAGWGAAAAAVAQIVAGIVSDRMRKGASRRVEFYVGGAIVSVAALLWFYSAPTFGGLFAALILLQIAMNVAIGPYQAAIPDFVAPEHMGRASSWMAALQSLGNAAGAITAGLIANTRVVAAVAGATLLASAALTARHAGTLTLRRAQDEPLKITRAFVDLFVSRALFYLGFYTLLGYLYFYLEATIGASARAFTGYTILIVTLAGVAGAWIASRAADAIDRRRLVSAGGVVFAAAICGLLFPFHAFGPVAAVAAVAGIGWGIFLTADWALGCGFIPRTHAATALAVWNLALLLPQIAAPFVATLVIRSGHALHSGAASRLAFASAVCEIALGIVWIWRLPASFTIEKRTVGNTPEGLRPNQT